MKGNTVNIRTSLTASSVERAFERFLEPAFQLDKLGFRRAPFHPAFLLDFQRFLDRRHEVVVHLAHRLDVHDTALVLLRRLDRADLEHFRILL